MRIWAVLVTLGWVVGAQSARAWTVAEVTGATAEVTVDRVDEAAVVRLEGDVSVRGGWLTRVELQLVSDEAALVREPRLFVLTDDDETERDVEPRVVRAVPLEHRFRKDGSLLLEFDRKNAPKKGHYRFEVLYHVPGLIADDGERAKLLWSFPPWQNGLDDVEVTVHLHRNLGVRAKDLQPLPDFDPPAVRYDRDGYISLHWMRPHLPRTLAWEVGLQIDGLAAPHAPPLQRRSFLTKCQMSESAKVVYKRRRSAQLVHVWWAFIGLVALLFFLVF